MRKSPEGVWKNLKVTAKCSVIHKPTNSVLKCHFFPQDSALFSPQKMSKPDHHNAFCVSELQVSRPEEVTWDRKAAHNALDQRNVTSKRLWERRSVNPSAQREYYNLIMESDLDHNRIYGCSESGFGSDVCSEAAKRWPTLMAREVKYPLTAHVLSGLLTDFQYFANQIKHPKSIPSHYYAIQQRVSHSFLSE